jgi:hypothetical protein
MAHTNFTSPTAGAKHTFAAGSNTKKPFFKVNNTSQVMICTVQIERSGM